MAEPLMPRADIIHTIADRLDRIKLPHPVRVGIDGFPASGKTVCAEELAAALMQRGRKVLRASGDGFHHHPEIRHRQGRHSPRGYYEDSFDLHAIRAHLLEPLGPGGDLRYRPALFDYRTESQVVETWEQAEADAVLLFDGLFLHRPELASGWDYTIFIDTDVQVTMDRARQRDRLKFGSVEAVQQVFSRRFLPGHGLYLDQVNPYGLADTVLDNTDVDQPVLLMRT